MTGIPMPTNGESHPVHWFTTATLADSWVNSDIDDTDQVPVFIRCMISEQCYLSPTGRRIRSRAMAWTGSRDEAHAKIKTLTGHWRVVRK